MLAKRLARHAPGVSSGALLAKDVASTGVPASVLSSTIKAASLFAAEQVDIGVTSVEAVAFAGGVLKAMFLTKLKKDMVAVLIVLGMVAFGARWSGTTPPQRSNPTDLTKSGSPINRGRWLLRRMGWTFRECGFCTPGRLADRRWTRKAKGNW
jgi:hypothetical protein